LDLDCAPTRDRCPGSPEIFDLDLDFVPRLFLSTVLVVALGKEEEEEKFTGAPACDKSMRKEKVASYLMTLACPCIFGSADPSVYFVEFNHEQL